MKPWKLFFCAALCLITSRGDANLLMAPASAPGATFALVSHTVSAQSGGLTVTTPAITTTGANLIVVVASYYEGSDTPTVTDSKSNTYTAAVTQLPGGSGSACRLWYTYAPVVGTGHTFTMTNTGGLAGAMAVATFSGAVAAPLDQTNSGSSTGSTVSPNSVTPTQNAELLVTGVGASNVNDTFSIDAGYTITDSLTYSLGIPAEGVAEAYLIQTTAASSGPTWTVSSGAGNAGDAACIATFK